MSNVNTTDRALILWLFLPGSLASIKPGYLISVLGNKQTHLILGTGLTSKGNISAKPHFPRSQWKLVPCTTANAQGPSYCLHRDLLPCQTSEHLEGKKKKIVQHNTGYMADFPNIS